MKKMFALPKEKTPTIRVIYKSQGVKYSTVMQRPKDFNGLAEFMRTQRGIGYTALIGCEAILPNIKPAIPLPRG